MIAFPKSKKVKLLTILILIFHLTPCYTYAQDNWTERDWVNYAKAQSISRNYSLEIFERIIPCKGFSEIRFSQLIDSLASIDIFETVTYNGSKIRESNAIAPVLTGNVTYFYLTGKIASEKSYHNNIPDGLEVGFYEDGKNFHKKNFKLGLIPDTQYIYYPKGELYSWRKELNEVLEESEAYWQNGKIAFQLKIVGKKDRNVKKYEFSQNIVKDYIYSDFEEKSFYFDSLGKSISEAKFEKIFNPKVIEQYYSRNRSSTDSELIEMEKKRKEEFSVRFHSNYILLKTENFNYDSISTLHYFSPNSYQSNADLLDTLYYSSKKLLRSASTKKGLLNGQLKYYYENGSIKAIANFRNDTLSGSYKVWYPNGQINIKSYFGGENDTTIIYSENGAIKSIKYNMPALKYIEEKRFDDGIHTSIKKVSEGYNYHVFLQDQDEDRYCRSIEIYKKYYYNKQGEEISREKFEKLYPELVEKSKSGTVKF
jgi:antitoxin component YwqK of YwqJK toxin-antitoxin module